MFTGIIQEKGKILKFTKKAKTTCFKIQTIDILKNKKIGDSISVDGACMTITKIQENNFEFDAMKETLERTNFQNYKEATIVNLENPLTISQFLDGHLVSGHIDCIGNVKKVIKNKDQTRITIEFPTNIEDLLAFKGSICLNGVSLTISDLQKQTFSVDLIPLTLEKTNLGNLKKGDKVNIEVDIIAKHIKRLLDCKENETKYEYLKERNLI